MAARPFYHGSLFGLSSAAAPGTQHLTYKPSWCLEAIHKGLHSLVFL